MYIKKCKCGRKVYAEAYRFSGREYKGVLMWDYICFKHYILYKYFKQKNSFNVFIPIKRIGNLMFFHRYNNGGYEK